MSYTALQFKKDKSGSVKKTSDQYSIYTKSVPFRLVGEAKELYANDWHDQNGTDEFIDESGLKMKSYEMEVEFVYKGSRSNASPRISSFINYLNGLDGSGVSMKMYDPYYGIGRQNVRYKSTSNDAKVSEINDSGNNILVEFSVTFVVNDPVTNITL